MATYNGAAYLREQVDSIVSQLRPGDELLVSDDGSSDETPGILASYGDRLRVVGSVRVGGVVPNFERVLGHAQGDMVVLADQDDVWLPGKLERLRTELQHCDFVMSNAVVVDAALRPLPRSLFVQARVAPGILRNAWHNSFVGCCVAFKSSLLSRALPFPSGTPWHDWLIGLLACVVGKVSFIDEPLMLYRRHGSNFSETGEASSNSLLARLLIRLRLAKALAIIVFRSKTRRRGAPT